MIWLHMLSSSPGSYHAVRERFVSIVFGIVDAVTVKCTLSI